MTIASDAAFFRVPHTTHSTSAGPVQLPIAYQDNSHCVAVFSVPADPLRRALRDEGLEPVVLGGRARVGLVFFEYEASAIGRYNEVGLASWVAPVGSSPAVAPLWQWFRDPRQRDTGMFVHDLPVTTEAACAAGRELWGYPKFVTEITIEWGRRDFRGVVRHPDDRTVLVELAGQRGLGVPVPPAHLLTYSRLDGKLLRTAVDARGRAFAARGGSLRVTVGRTPHRMAEHLREFGLDGATPELVLDARHTRSLLHAGTSELAIAARPR